MRKPPTGEPYAGKLLVRFGGRGGESLPDPYQGRCPEALDCHVGCASSQCLGGRSPQRHRCAKLFSNQTSKRRSSEMQATTVGLDIAKSVFQVHMENEQGQIVKQQRLRRA